ncbi:hypothetical protein ACSBR1_016553 [Camellia fascicularis]
MCKDNWMSSSLISGAKLVDVLELLRISKLRSATSSGGKHAEFVSIDKCKVAVFYGGVNIKVRKNLLKNECPYIVVGTLGRILALGRDKELGLKNVRHFILDECDKMLESLEMRRDV